MQNLQNEKIKLEARIHTLENRPNGNIRIINKLSRKLRKLA